MAIIGQVVRWNADRGFGFVRLPDGREAFLHVSDIQPTQGRGASLQGHEVEIHRLTETPQGPRIGSATLDPLVTWYEYTAREHLWHGRTLVLPVVLAITLKNGREQWRRAIVVTDPTLLAISPEWPPRIREKVTERLAVLTPEFAQWSYLDDNGDWIAGVNGVPGPIWRRPEFWADIHGGAPRADELRRRSAKELLSSEEDWWQAYLSACLATGILFTGEPHDFVVEAVELLRLQNPPTAGGFHMLLLVWDKTKKWQQPSWVRAALVGRRDSWFQACLALAFASREEAEALMPEFVAATGGTAAVLSHVEVVYSGGDDLCDYTWDRPPESVVSPGPGYYVVPAGFCATHPDTELQSVPYENLSRYETLTHLVESQPTAPQKAYVTALQMLKRGFWGEVEHTFTQYLGETLSRPDLARVAKQVFAMGKGAWGAVHRLFEDLKAQAEAGDQAADEAWLTASCATVLALGVARQHDSVAEAVNQVLGQH